MTESWQADDVQRRQPRVVRCCLKQISSILTNDSTNTIINKIGYIVKGGGSAYGGEWIPKKEQDKRFLGKPDTTKISKVKTGKGEYTVIDHYDNTGRVDIERHETDHDRPDLHSDPHDHKIDWNDGFPKFSPPINYPDGNVPELKSIHNIGESIMKNVGYDPDEYKFESLSEFKFVLYCGANVGFEWNGTEYGIEGHNDSFDIWIYGRGTLVSGLTLEDALNYELDGTKLKDLILNAKITERIL